MAERLPQVIDKLTPGGSAPQKIGARLGALGGESSGWSKEPARQSGAMNSRNSAAILASDGPWMYIMCPASK